MNNLVNREISYRFEPVKGELGMKLVSPRKILLFWEVSSSPLKVIEHFFNKRVEELIQAVRLYDVTDRIFNGQNAHYFHEVIVPYQNGHWYIKGLLSNRNYVAELGVKIPENEFFPLLRSNPVQTPLMKMTSSNEMQLGLSIIQQIENSKQKWVDRVSTYSYYEE